MVAHLGEKLTNHPKFEGKFDLASQGKLKKEH
jgi:hypothetical protein